MTLPSREMFVNAILAMLGSNMRFKSIAAFCRASSISHKRVRRYTGVLPLFKPISVPRSALKPYQTLKSHKTVKDALIGRATLEFNNVI
jgi:predicted RNA-binding protein